jgi:hypothetical protein
MSSAAKNDSESLISYHERNCKICRHEDRAAIEFDFLNWRNAEYIAKEYGLSFRSLYRHAHALGLFEQRRERLRSPLELMIEGAGKIVPTADGVLRAIEMYARMNDKGELAQVPKTQVIVVSRDASQHPLPNIPGLNIDQAALDSTAASPAQPATSSQTDFDLTHSN